MSLEAALDEEMREVMALLEGKPRPATQNNRNASPQVGYRAQSPPAPVSPLRSMLDVGPTTATRDAAVAEATGHYTSMLDPSSPPTSARSASRASRGPASPPPAMRGLGSPGGINPESAYQFEMLPTVEAHSLPKRVTQGGKKKQKQQKGAMASIYGTSADILGTSRDRERHNSHGIIFGKSTKSGSPVPGRSVSPGGRKLNSNTYLMSDPKKFVLDSGKVVDMDSAYRRLSDAALLRSGGTLSQLPTRKGSDPSKGESVGPRGGVRLEKDIGFGDDGDAVYSSEEDDSTGSSGAESWSSEKRRGRRRTRQADKEKHGGDQKKPKSLLAAAEEEREYIEF